MHLEESPKIEADSKMKFSCNMKMKNSELPNAPC